MIGCSENEIAALVAEQTNPCDDDPNGPACELHCESNPEQCESETNSNAENETGPNDNSPDNPGTNEENEALNNNLLSTSDGSDIPWNIIGIIAGIVIVLLVTLLVLKGGSKENMGGFDSGFGGEPMGMGTGDITPEQHAYEQQLIAGGYPPEYARQYADQHFRPWLNS
jgi:hypothetical protein